MTRYENPQTVTVFQEVGAVADGRKMLLFRCWGKAAWDRLPICRISGRLATCPGLADSRLAALAAVLLGGPAAAPAAVTLTDTTSVATFEEFDDGQALGESFTVSPGADVLVVEVGMSDSVKTDDLALSYGTQSFTSAIQQISSNSGNYMYSDIYYLDNPSPASASRLPCLRPFRSCLQRLLALGGEHGHRPHHPRQRRNHRRASNSVSLPGSPRLRGLIRGRRLFDGQPPR